MNVHERACVCVNENTWRERVFVCVCISKRNLEVRPRRANCSLAAFEDPFLFLDIQT